jgi:uncharacterized protein (TIGR02147 family)
VNIFAYTSYREIFQHWLAERPNGGRGSGSKLAAHLKVSTVLVSQVLRGTRTLQLDHAFGVAEYMGLTAQETEYFMLLVQHEHAGTLTYRAYLKGKIEQKRSVAKEVQSRVARDIQLSEEIRARFYSHWHYSAIRLLTDIPATQTPASIARRLNLEMSRVNEILAFLEANKLCTHHAGRFKMAVKSTHLESSSPWIYSRQLQWRQKAIQSMERTDPRSIYYTGPMVLSQEDAAWVREKLLEAIREITERARDSKSEALTCLNIDWFAV